MIKALFIGLSLALSLGVAFAQPKKAPARKRPAAGAKKTDPKKADPKKTDPKADDLSPAPAPAATQPDAKPDGAPPSAPDTKLPGASDAKLPGATAPNPLPATTSPSPTAATPTPIPTPKTDTTPPPAKAGASPPDAKRSSGPLKTDEKATSAALEKSACNTDYRNVSPDDEQAALIAFRQGNAYLNDGFFAKAAEKYREALSHWNHPAIHYNMALALINLNQPIEVFDELTKAMACGPPALGDQEKFDRAKGYMTLVEGQLADVEVSCDKIGAKVSVDGKDVFVAPGKYTAKVRVGKHTFYADKEGYNARITAPYIGPGEHFRIELKVYTAKELTDYRRKWKNTWFPYVVLGAGAVVGIAAGGIELSAQSSYDQFNTKVAACNTTAAGCPINTPGITSPRNSGDTKRVIGYVGYSLAGAAIATGTVLLWLNRQQEYQLTPEQLESRHAAAAAAPVAIAPIVSPDVMGAMVQGHF